MERSKAKAVVAVAVVEVVVQVVVARTSIISSFTHRVLSSLEST